jgi:RNA polymerase sigma-70 factor, ECF subfamily
MRRNTENCSVASGIRLSTDHNSLIGQLFAESGARSWGVARETFASWLERSAKKHFANQPVSSGKVEDYLRSLHLQDLALACACAEGNSAAWEQFVSTYRVYLRSSAAVILRCPANSPAACELADSLFADLYGLTEGKRAEPSPIQSLFRYFHGRSSLKTWLRAVLAQRHIDGIRAGRRFTELATEDSGSNELRGSVQDVRNVHCPDGPDDPHRARYVVLFTRTLEVALGLLNPGDKERLRLYYADGETLAEIGRRFGEHESSVSRNLERTRRALRLEVEQALRKGCVAGNGLVAQAGLSEEEISLCFEYAAEDAPIDLDKLLPQPAKQTLKAERKDP